MTEIKREITPVEEYNRQGKILYSMDKYKETLSFYSKAEKADPMFIQTYFNLAEAYVMLDRYEEAKKSLKRAQMIDKNNGEIYFHFGNIALLEENINEAKQHFANALVLGYRNPYLYMNLGTAYEDVGDNEAALSNYNKAIQIDKYFAPAWMNKLGIYMDQEQFSEALSVSESIIELFPDMFEGYHFKFAILMQLGNKADAKEILDRALIIFPDDPGFKMDMVHYLGLVQKYEEAESLLDKEFGSEPDFVIYSKVKIQLLLQQDKIPDAMEFAEKTLAENFDEEINFMLTNIYFTLKQYGKAIAATEKTLEKKSQSGYYYTALYFNALAHKKNGDDTADMFSMAVNELRTACSQNPGMIDLYIYRALCYKELKEYERANEMVEYLMALSDKEQPEVLLIRAEINKEMGNTEAYEADRSAALKLNPQLEKLIM